MTPCVETSLLVRKELTEASYPHLMLEFRMFSALATIIANEHSDDGFTTTTRPGGAPTPTLRQAVSEVMSGQRMHARTVALGADVVRHGRSIDASNGRHRAPSSAKPSPFRGHSELRGHFRAEIEVVP